MFWFNGYLDANVDSYKSLNFVGVVNGFAFMILVWVVLFTWEHGEEEISLAKVIADVVARGADTDGRAEESILATEAVVGQTGMEDEF